MHDPVQIARMRKIITELYSDDCQIIRDGKISIEMNKRPNGKIICLVKYDNVPIEKIDEQLTHLERTLNKKAEIQLKIQQLYNVVNSIIANQKDHDELAISSPKEGVVKVCYKGITIDIKKNQDESVHYSIKANEQNVEDLGEQFSLLERWLAKLGIKPELPKPPKDYDPEDMLKKLDAALGGIKVPAPKQPKVSDPKAKQRALKEALGEKKATDDPQSDGDNTLKHN